MASTVCCDELIWDELRRSPQQSQPQKETFEFERQAVSSDLGCQELLILAEVEPLVAVLKPRGLAVNARCEKKDCIINRLEQQRGDKWCALKRFWLPVKMCGVVLCARASELSAADEATRQAPLELCFDAVIHVEGDEGANSVPEEAPLPLLAHGTEAMLCKLDEVGRLAHVSARVVLAGNAVASVAEVADALTDAFARAGCPVAGTLKGCRRLKRQCLLKNERALSLARVRCGAVDSGMLLPSSRLARVLAAERAFADGELQLHAQRVAELVALLTGPRAASHCEYEPELQRLGMRRLGATPELARDALDQLGLLAPSDVAWASHAHAMLGRHMVELWTSEPRERQRLQYGMHVSRLLCCCVRVQRDGRVPVESVTQGVLIEPDAVRAGVGGPLRATELCFDRSNHCELLALNEAHALCAEHSSTGEGCAVDLIVAHQPCVSCTAAMCNFATMLPRARLNVGFRDWRAVAAESCYNS